MSCHVFISHKSEDYSLANRIKNHLESEGIFCWIAPDCIEGGKSYASQISDAIQEAAALLVLITKSSVGSDNISKELDLAVKNHVRIMPFAIESVPLTGDFSYYLSNVQSYPAYNDFDQELMRLTLDIRHHLGMPERNEHIFGKIETDNVLSSAFQSYTNQFCFGNYPQKKNGYMEPIEWVVLKRDSLKMLVISKYGIDCKRFNPEGIAVSWETCALRSWLNNVFLNGAFDTEEKRWILISDVVADKNPKYCDNWPGNSTRDRIFLLSVVEAERYFVSNETRQCRATEYAKSHGAYTNTSNGNCWSWLRTPGVYLNSASVIYYDGSVDTVGYYVDYNFGTVRPAMWLSVGN